MLAGEPGGRLRRHGLLPDSSSRPDVHTYSRSKRQKVGRGTVDELAVLAVENLGGKQVSVANAQGADLRQRAPRALSHNNTGIE